MKKESRFPTDHDYLASVIKANHISKKDVSKLIGKNEQYLSYCKTTKTGLTNDDIVELQDLLDDLDMKKLVVRSSDNAPQEVNDDSHSTTNSMLIDNLIKKIGELEARMARFEERLATPITVSIPMNAKDMAVLVMGDLLEGGWCTKDDVLVAFNKHHIPIEHISHALKENNAISATAGVANNARTFYIKQE